jgi:hypothetical protein
MPPVGVGLGVGPMTEKRAEALLTWMSLVDMYTLTRAFDGLTQEEFDWEPHEGAWGVRRRDACPTADPHGADGSEWVVDNDTAIVEAAFHGKTIEPMTTIGWLLNHFGAAPGLAADLEIVGGPTVPTFHIYARAWAHTIIPTADEAVSRFREGWSALAAGLRTTTDEMLERDYEGHPWKRGDRAISALVNEISHHGTQICVLRDLYAHREH